LFYLHQDIKAPAELVIYSLAMDKLVKSCGKHHQPCGLCASIIGKNFCKKSITPFMFRGYKEQKAKTTRKDVRRKIKWMRR